MKTKHDKVADAMGHKTLNGVCIDAEKHAPQSHTPTPWLNHLRNENSGGTRNIVVEENGFYKVIGQVENHEDAAFIVRAVNCHEELLEALRNITAVFIDMNDSERMKILGLQSKYSNAIDAIARASA